MARPASLGRSGAIVASGTLVSRVLGFVNALLLYNTIGTVGQSADAFALANQLPNNIYLILAGGTITAIIVPAIVRATGHADGGERFLNRLVTLGLTIFLVVAAAITVAAPLVVRLYGSGFTEAQLGLAFGFAYWLMPEIFFYGVFAILSEVLNARGVFWPYAWAPVINNLVLAGVLIAFRIAFGVAAGKEPGDWGTGEIVLLAGGATLGIAVQALVLVLAWRRAGIRYRPDFRWRGSGLGHFGRLAAWTFVGTLAAQLGGIVESNVVSTATGSASIAALTLARLIFTLPWSLVTLSVAVPYFTRMSEHAKREDRVSLAGDLTRAIEAVLLLLVFATAGLAVLAPWLATLFTSDADGRVAVAGVLALYLIGLVPTSVQSILMRGWYAMHDTRTPTLFYFAQIAVYVVLLLTWVLHAPEGELAGDAAISMAIAFTVNAVLCVLWMRRTLPAFRVARILGRLLWYALAMVPAAAAGIGVDRLFRDLGIAVFPDGATGGALLTAVVGGIAMAVVYVAALWLSRNPEIRAILQPLTRRIRRVK